MELTIKAESTLIVIFMNRLYVPILSLNRRIDEWPVSANDILLAKVHDLLLLSIIFIFVNYIMYLCMISYPNLNSTLHLHSDRYRMYV